MKKMNNKFVIAIVASVITGVLTIGILSPQAFSSEIRKEVLDGVAANKDPELIPEEPYPDADIVVRDYNQPPSSEFLVSVEKSDITLRKSDVGQVIPVQIKSWDNRPLEVSLELYKADGAKMDGAGLEGKIRHSFDAGKVQLAPQGESGSTITVNLTLFADSAAQEGTMDAELYVYALDGTVYGEKDPSKSLDFWSGYTIPFRITITE
ncbi:hypothetical protein [Nitrososphaera sp.]|uniref:hypothetical protein n=1 Tax=Nitrososphaera sp. TaxID=1971748 RepID=UPI003170DCDC